MPAFVGKDTYLFNFSILNLWKSLSTLLYNDNVLGAKLDDINTAACQTRAATWGVQHSIYDRELNISSENEYQCLNTILNNSIDIGDLESRLGFSLWHPIKTFWPGNVKYNLGTRYLIIKCTYNCWHVRNYNVGAG